MTSTVIITDSSCDLPLSYIKENNVPVLGIVCNFKGKDYIEDFGQTLTYEEFYNGVRSGEMPSTAQINSFRFEEEFEKYLLKGDSIIYIGFSSALSGTYNSAVMAKNSLLEKYPNADITIIDSKCASMGVGVVVYYAYEMLKQGKSKDEIVNWINNNILKINHYFTVNDLYHLKRGGRVSSTSALIGTILDIKPILHVNAEGKLIPLSKVKGRKKSIKTLFEYLKQNIIDPENQVIFISHGDCLEDANHLEDLIRKEFNIKDCMINHIGPAIGSHSGPDTLALFFLGNDRAI